ncbi:MAG: 4-alpha-glucanotransferase [Ardenticatenaceae bacterium]|nr:4-alpha-glucanotransferase [Ardenticatenaceae bacterium]
MFVRSAGVLLHPSSLPSRYGIGDCGDSAYEFINFLETSGQTLWQTLPLGPTGYGDSPYQSFSAFAGNPLLISPDHLVRDGYLPPAAVEKVPPFPAHRVDYGWVIHYKNDLLHQSFHHFQAKGQEEQQKQFEAFCDEKGWWLDDYALFMALKGYFVEHEGGVWNTWPADIRDRKPKAMAYWLEKLKDEVAYQKFIQFLFFTQWLKVKQYANDKGISIIGDMPIFVAFDSADVWGNRHLFYLNEDGSPQVIAGVPPDYFSETGQRWGNPLYRWDKLMENDYVWWEARLKEAFVLADITRIDHFRGFEAYWEIPADEPTAVVGQWVKGPGVEFFKTLENKLGRLPIIAEDLGVITPEVENLRDEAGFPGMKILQFAFGGEKNSNFLPHNFIPNCVVYTGSHDNETAFGWYQNASEDEQDHVRRYVARDGFDIVWDMIRLALSSVAVMAIIPLQDLMTLDNKARMNFPGKTGGYWAWRFAPEMLDSSISDRLYEMTLLYGRLAEQNTE